MRSVVSPPDSQVKEQKEEAERFNSRLKQLDEAKEEYYLWQLFHVREVTRGRARPLNGPHRAIPLPLVSPRAHSRACVLWGCRKSHLTRARSQRQPPHWKTFNSATTVL